MIFDTTLRDGEQTPGISLTPSKKLSIARALDQLGVAVIEAGFAAISSGEREAVKLISHEGFSAEICSAARSVQGDIDAAIEAGVDGVNIIVPTSDLHIKKKLGKTKKEILEIIEEVVVYAKDHGLIVDISCEDGSRTDRNFMKIIIKKGIEVGIDRITLCDTVGSLTPESSYDLFKDVRKEFPEVIIGVHCHNDFGLAVANSLAAIKAGANIAHCTVNGLGERAGNASLEELTVALKLLYDVDVGIKTELLTKTSQLVSRTTGIMVQPNKAIVGQNAFAHESGIHTHAINKDPNTYEVIDPKIVGTARRIVSGKHTGSTGLSMSLEEMGFKPSNGEFKAILGRVKELGDQGNKLADTDLFAIAEKVMGVINERPFILEEFIVTTGNKITPTASVKLTQNGQSYIEASTGNGPVDATLNAVIKAIQPEQRVQLDIYHVEAITGGTDAVVNVEVQLRQGDKIVTSRGINEDIVIASVDAYLKGLNLYTSITSRGKL
jgi:D-citramalate synthase